MYVKGKKERILWFASEGWIHSYPLLRGDEKNKDAFPLSLLANSMDRFWRQLFLCAAMRAYATFSHTQTIDAKDGYSRTVASRLPILICTATQRLLCSLIKKLALFLSVFIRQAEAQAMMLSCLSSKLIKAKSKELVQLGEEYRWNIRLSLLVAGVDSFAPCTSRARNPVAFCPVILDLYDYAKRIENK